MVCRHRDSSCVPTCKVVTRFGACITPWRTSRLHAVPTLVRCLLPNGAALRWKRFVYVARIDRRLLLVPCRAGSAAVFDHDISMSEPMPSQTKIRTLREGSEYSLEALGVPALQVTTDPTYVQDNSEGLEFWSLENRALREPAWMSDVNFDPSIRALDELSDS